MRIKLFAAGAVIAFAAGIGSASAGERFDSLEGVAAQALSSAELSAIRAGDWWIYKVEKGHGSGHPITLVRKTSKTSKKVTRPPHGVIIKGRGHYIELVGDGHIGPIDNLLDPCCGDFNLNH